MPAATAAAPSCSPACVERVKARQFAEKHGGCRDAACVRRVADKRHVEAARRITPYACNGQHFAIPCSIVMCESRGRWTAYNPSGAAGPYQIMPMHGRPWPANTAAKRLAHHRIAARLWAGGRGARNWVCAHL